MQWDNEQSLHPDPLDYLGHTDEYIISGFNFSYKGMFLSRF